MKHELPALPYSRTALHPFMSAETLDFHHGKHHRAYVEKLNELVAGTEFEKLSLEELIKTTAGPIFNNAAQAWNHEFFWKCLSPDQPKMSGLLLKLVEQSFGSLFDFEEQFLKKGSEAFGSGWLWLIQDGNKLKLETMHDAENPLRTGRKPILTCDLWEHAYYIDYRNERPKYLEAFSELVNWDFVAMNLKSFHEKAA